MNTDRIRALLTVIDTGSLSTAAEKLGYTTSGISRMMAALEEDTGFMLLIRGHDGVSPTENCRMLLPEFRRLIFCEESCMQLAREISGVHKGTVRIGIAYNSMFRTVEGAIRRFRGIYPDIEFHLRSGFTAELLSALEDHRLDLCLVSYRKGEFLWRGLFEDEILAWIPKDHPCAAEDAVPIERFATDSYIDIYPGIEIDNKLVLEEAGIVPNTQMEAMDNFAAYSMVAAGLGITMNNRMNSVFTGDAVAYRPILPRQTVQIGIASLADASPATRRFLEFLRLDMGDKNDASDH